MALPISTILQHYKRPEIQQEILANAKDREIAVRFEDIFGPRPDTLTYPGDILELAKQGATSFHASEELWSNPLQLNPDMKRHELEKLRKGWDLVIDVDCPYWEFSKLITHLLIQALKKHGVKSISCKFSGNKGFHIGVPFEAFPKKAGGKDIRLLFPDGVRKIAAYLTYYIDSSEMDHALSSAILEGKEVSDIAKELGVPAEKLIMDVCAKCQQPLEEKKDRTMEMACPYCGTMHRIGEEKLHFECTKCRKLVRIETSAYGPVCKTCGRTTVAKKFDLHQILSVDALLISSRHLFRMPYSLHEKSGLCSIPVDPEKVLAFEKKEAMPPHVKASRFRFLERKDIPAEDAARLFDDAFHWDITSQQERNELQELFEGKTDSKGKAFDNPAEAVPAAFFPPCIQLILKGMEDGRKRAVFILVNFLTSTGWGYEQIEKLLKEWNQRNKEPLREVNITGAIRYHKQQKKKFLPPNCRNMAYYSSMNVCKPDAFCRKITNPANYALLKARSAGETKKKK